MTRRLLALASLATLAFAAPVTARAQSPFKLGLALGPSFTSGDLGDTQEWGYHIAGSIGGRPMLSPIGLRAEVMYHSFTGKEVDLGVIGTAEYDDANVIAGIVNAEIGMSGVGLQPYLIGGVGYYSFGSGGEDVDRVGRAGLNGGIGLRFGLAGFAAFAEARYHKILTNDDDEADGITGVAFIPVSVGVSF